MINAKRVRQDLEDHLKEDSALLKDFAELTMFGAVLASGSALAPAAGVVLVMKTAGAVISACTRIVQRLSDETDRDTRALPHSYDRFRVLFYVVCQRCYFQALDDRLRTLPLSDKKEVAIQPGTEAFEQLLKSFGERAAQIDEAEIRFHYSINPTDHDIPLYKAYSRWLELTLHTLKFGDSQCAGVVRSVEKEARQRFHAAIAADEPASKWIRNYLALESQAHEATGLLSDLSSIRATLEGWKAASLPASTRHAESWRTYREMLIGLPDQRETMFGEDFGVRQVFVPPLVSYHRAGLSGVPDDTSIAPDIARLIGALASTRLTGEDLVFLCGGPGCGKSTICRFLASELAKDNDIHPVFIRLRRFKEGAELSAHLEDVLARNGLIDRLADLQGFSNVVLILDGFDELVMASRARLRHFFSVLLDDLRVGPLRNARAVVAGRDTLFPKGEGLPRGSHVLNVLPFDKERVAAWSEKWRACHAHGPAQEFYPEAFVGGEPGEGPKAAVHHLVTWPLTLHLVARVHTSGLLNIGPKSQAEVEKAYLYRSILAETSARQAEKELGVGRLDPGKMRGFLRGVAWKMYSNSVDSLDSQEVVPLLREFFPGVQEGDLGELAEVAVLSAPEIHKGHDTGFEFVHKSFSEYLAAEVIAQVVDDTCYRIRDDVTAQHEWRRSLSEVGRACAKVFGIRAMSQEVQVMLEPMLGVWAQFVRGVRVDEVVSSDLRRQGLERIVERFQDLFREALMGDGLALVSEVLRTERRPDAPLEYFANYCLGIGLVGVSAARQLGKEPKRGDEVLFQADPFEGAFWRWLFILHAGGIQTDGELAQRLFSGLTVNKPAIRTGAGSRGLDDWSLPIRLAPLQAVDGYVRTLSAAVDEVLASALLMTVMNLELGRGGQSEGTPERRQSPELAGMPRHEWFKTADYAMHELVALAAILMDHGYAGTQNQGSAPASAGKWLSFIDRFARHGNLWDRPGSRWQQRWAGGPEFGPLRGLLSRYLRGLDGPKAMIGKLRQGHQGSEESE